ncbi:pilus assembly protein TadG-related protein [Streptomyces sp. SYP-A7185]|uniref:pilus assembly protein TadG-related protein n=1 Tax=Streptomyces sp. SYP-A7185 TaxID=3040076 RepID=UPI0038F697EC
MTLYFLGFALVMIGLLALLVDGGRLLMASADAEDIAAEAARSAGQEINGPDAITGEGTRADPQKAVTTAQAFLTDAGVQGIVTIAEDGQRIAITVHDTYQTLLLGGFGYSSMQVTAHADVTLERTDPGA